jgi:hypothetical protein
MHRRLAVLVGSLATLLGVVGVAFGWEANFDPSTFNPAVDETVTYAVCQPCLEGETVRYSWDFNGDGVPDVETDDETVMYAFSVPGFHDVVLTVTSDYGRVDARRKGILVGAAPAYAVREVLPQDDGTVFVLITIEIVSHVNGLGFTENLPAGWQFEVLDTGGAFERHNPGKMEREVVWFSEFDEGMTVTFSYRLHRGPAAPSPSFEGTLSGYTRGSEGQVRFAGAICGELALP